MTDITGAIELERNKSISWLGLVHELKADRTLARRFNLVLVVQVGFNFSGGNSITYYENAILDTIGIDGNGAYLFASIYGMVKLVSSLVYAFLCAERFGRRKMLLFSGFVDVACVTWIAIYLAVLDGNKKGGYASVAALCVFAFGYGTGWSPVAFGLNGGKCLSLRLRRLAK
jgi:SP family sugar:H+ symporter-like MFS transporter